MSNLVVGISWPSALQPSRTSPAQRNTARNASKKRDSSVTGADWAARTLEETWGDVGFDIGLRLDVARIAWTDGPTLSALSCSFRSISHALRLELHRTPSLAAMAWLLHVNRCVGDGKVGTARKLFVEQTLASDTRPDDWGHLHRIGQVAAARASNGRPTWGEVAIVERLLHGAPDDVIDAALVLAGESEMGMADVIRAAHRL